MRVRARVRARMCMYVRVFACVLCLSLFGCVFVVVRVSLYARACARARSKGRLTRGQLESALHLLRLTDLEIAHVAAALPVSADDGWSPRPPQHARPAPRSHPAVRAPESHVRVIRGANPGRPNSASI